MVLEAYLGHVVSPLAAGGLLDYRRGCMLVRDGVIEDVIDLDRNQSVPAEARVHDLGNRLIMPGLIDMHLHLPQVTQTGKSGQHLLAWLNQYIFAAEARFADTDHARKIARWFFDELAANGTTCAVVFTTIHKDACDAAFEIAEAKGSRVIMGKVLMDANSPPALTEDTQTSLAESEELLRKWHGRDGGRLQYALTPRFGVTSTPELLAGVGEIYARHKGVYVHTHLSEAREEIQCVAKMYPGARSYLDVYRSFGIIGRRTVFAHSIHIDSDDIDCLCQTQSSLAHCPSSNFFLKSGVFQYKTIKDAGVLFGLGSDVAAGPSMSLFNVMRDANYIQGSHWLEPQELLYRATLGAAIALDQDDRIGSLEAGKEADFIVVDPTARTAIVGDILDHPTHEILSALVFLGDDRLIARTYVRGRLIFDGQIAQNRLVKQTTSC